MTGALSKHRPSFIFITGGVASSLGKGIASAAIGTLLLERGLKVRLRKLDPYLNVDPGTMSPHQHGEVYITEDGAETDLDLGHYERFTGISCRRSDNVTAGRIYAHVLQRERRGDYLGSTVQVIPHVTDAIKSCIRDDLKDEDIVICEIGGTVGDIESLPFLEAIRQMRNEEGARRVMFIHLTLLPWIAAAKELKTKPTQHSVKELLSVGIQPDLLICRCDRDLDDGARAKISLFCNVAKDAVMTSPDTDTIYHVPLLFHEQKMDHHICTHFGLDTKLPRLAPWRAILKTFRSPEDRVAIAVVGKYNDTVDSYKSLMEALFHGGLANRTKVDIHWIDAEVFENEDPGRLLGALSEPAGGPVGGILVPGGFGERGVQGKIAAAAYARKTKIPYFGICLGMQVAVVEAARHLAKLEDAGSTEFGRPKNPVIALMTEWRKGDRIERRGNKTDKGASMRLGGYACHLADGTLARRIYRRRKIIERHRHRYEFNMDYKKCLEDAGICFSGRSPDGQLCEIIEIPGHPWFVGVQFHPELVSRPFAPHPLFKDFIRSARAHRRLV